MIQFHSSSQGHFLEVIPIVTGDFTHENLLLEKPRTRTRSLADPRSLYAE
jgi:hypothetical protein